MPIKSILCLFGGGSGEANALDAAFTLGKRYGAHIRVLHVSPNPRDFIGLAGGDGLLEISTMVEQIQKKTKESLRLARSLVKKYAQIHHVPLDMPEAVPHHSSARFIHVHGNIDDNIVREGILSDLIIVGHSEAESGAQYDTAIISALFNSGRPVLLMPNTDRKPNALEFETIALAWNGSREVATAIQNAMPFLERAKMLYSLTAKHAGTQNVLELQPALREYLHAHGLNTTGIIVTRETSDCAAEILRKCRELDVELLVMGAYSHSRLLEIMLGGFTGYMLENATIPLLLCHR